MGDSTLKTLVLRAVGGFTGDHVRVLRAVADLDASSSSSGALPKYDEYVSVATVRSSLMTIDDAKYTAIINDLVRGGVLAGYFPTTYGGGSGEAESVALSLFGREVTRFLRAGTLVQDPRNDD